MNCEQLLSRLPASVAAKASIVTTIGGTRIDWRAWNINIEVEWNHNEPIDLVVTFAPGEFEAVSDAIAEIVAQAIE